MQELIDKGEEHEDYQDERLPYWADLWHSAIGLASYLATESIIRPGMAVTEIGCGLGLPGIVAGMLGGQVVLTDYLPEALEVTRLNWEQNIDTEGRFEVMDWRTPRPELSAALVLASDVAYEERSFEALIAALPSLVRPGGRIILSEPSRAMAQEFIKQLMDWPAYHSKLSTIDIEWDGFGKRVQLIDLQAKSR